MAHELNLEDLLGLAKLLEVLRVKWYLSHAATPTGIGSESKDITRLIIAN